MKAKTNFKRGLYSITLFPNNLTFKSMLTIALVWLSIPTPVQAQEVQYTKPSWWFGVRGSQF